MLFRRGRRDRALQDKAGKKWQPSVKEGDRIYAIGDIHGRYDLLRDLLGQIEAHSAALAKPERTFLVILGDMIDRGMHSAEVLNYLFNVRRHSAGLIVLMGNHEELMLRSLQKEPGVMRAWLRIGGDATLRSFGIDPKEAEKDPYEVARKLERKIPEEDLEWLRSLPVMARSGDYLFCHAGIRPGVSLSKQSRTDLLWIRDEFLDDPTPSGAIVVHGHSISADVQIKSNRIGIDTGAYRTGVLTALYLEGTRRGILSTEGILSKEGGVLDLTELQTVLDLTELQTVLDLTETQKVGRTGA